MNASVLEQLYKEAEIAINSAKDVTRCIRVIKEYKDRASASYGDRRRIAKIGQMALEKFNQKPVGDKDYRPPTPHEGDWVQWFSRGRTEEPVAALVTRRLSPGKVKLTLFPEDRSQEYKLSVYHAGHPLHSVPGNQTVKNGSWDYVPGTKVPEEHYDLWKAHNKQIVDANESQQKRFEEEQALEKARKANRIASKVPSKVLAGEEFQEPGEV